MSVSLFSLPCEVTTNICKYLSIESLRTLREVCKASERIVGMLISTQKRLKPYGSMLQDIIVEDKGGEYKIEFDAVCQKYAVLWKLCLFSALRQLHIPMEALSNSSGPMLYMFKITLKSEDDLKQLLEHLKPIIRTALIICVSLIKTSAEINRICFEILKLKRFHLLKISATQEIIDYAQWLQIFKQVDIKWAIFNDIPNTSDSIDFMTQMSDVVKILAFTFSSDQLVELPLSIVQQIFDRKCYSLSIAGACSYSSADIEKLVQFLHHKEKKVYFEIPTSTGPMNINIGEYMISTNWHEKIRISHLALDKYGRA